MIRHQSIIDLWIKSGEIINNQDPVKVSEDLDYYYLLVGRINQICISAHGGDMFVVIPAYIEKGWIQADPIDLDQPLNPRADP
jgi:hypothetical protein